MPLYLILSIVAASLLFLSIGLGCYAGFAADFRVRSFFWLSLSSGLFASAIAIGVAGAWWMALGPVIPLFFIVLLRIRFPVLFGLNGCPKPDALEKESDNRGMNAYNDVHENIDENRNKHGEPHP